MTVQMPPDEQIYSLEYQLGELTAQIDRLRARDRNEQVVDYAFRDWRGDSVRLSQLFEDQENLIVVFNMGAQCDYCTMWADGINGILPYLKKFSAVVVASPDPIEVQKDIASRHEWKFRMVSAEGTPFFAEMGFTDPKDASPLPGTSTFRLDEGGSVRRYARAYFGPHDKFCPVYSFLDLLPRGIEEVFRP